ncbi:hypothetical protein JZ751_010486 [Albula glossodonta]|uniref:Uncharacterized protein n=1 Tax=Albula glossodonta TaxID=121402 RepID=A0A8T2NXA5_9TELE|nr:hypothetical protein JZ751_010486 [Albula glossodonta]
MLTCNVTGSEMVVDAPSSNGPFQPVALMHFRVSCRLAVSQTEPYQRSAVPKVPHLSTVPWNAGGHTREPGDRGHATNLRASSSAATASLQDQGWVAEPQVALLSSSDTIARAVVVTDAQRGFRAQQSSPPALLNDRSTSHY